MGIATWANDRRLTGLAPAAPATFALRLLDLTFTTAAGRDSRARTSDSNFILMTSSPTRFHPTKVPTPQSGAGITLSSPHKVRVLNDALRDHLGVLPAPTHVNDALEPLEVVGR
jgi:hypothetical protein